jgi:ATP-binding cassette subfamily B protein
MGFHGGGWWSYIRYDEEQDRPEITRDLLKRVWEYAQPYTSGVTLLLLTILGISSLSLVTPLLIRDFIDNALPNRDIQRFTLLIVGMVSVPIVNGLLGVLQRYIEVRIGEGIIYDLRRSLFMHMQRMSVRFFTNTKVGELMSRLNNDVVGAQSAVTDTAVSIVSNVVSLVATVAIMVTLDWRLTLLSIAILPLFILPARRVGRILRDIIRQALETNARMNAIMSETLNISGALHVKIFGRAATETEKFDEQAGNVRDIGIRRAVVGRWFFMGLSLVSAIGSALVFWIGGRLVLSGVFTIGTIVAFTAYLRELYGPLMALTNARIQFATSLVSFERVFEVLDLPVEITEKPDALKLENVQGRVRFQDVSFSYEEGNGDSMPAGLEDVRRFTWHAGNTTYVPPARKDNGDAAEDGKPEGPRWALQNVSFEIKPGQLAALVGPSGAGKTTITYLLPRLYEVTEGAVALDGHDVREVTLDTLSAQIGMVTQETYLFHDTIRANLLYAKPDATQAELEAACRAANIHEFIAGLPDGYDMVVGERGYRLSGGEKQRVAIARVILKDPQVLVLDEATSHLDAHSEALIQEALEGIMRGRTSLVIAHRLSTILAADVILVMDKGRLVEQGTHEELLAEGGVYAHLYETQFRHDPAKSTVGQTA